MGEARDELSFMSDEEVFEWHSQFDWMIDYLHEECPPELHKETLDFLENLAYYKYSFEMNGEALPKTNMGLFGDGAWSDQYIPNWLFGFVAVIPAVTERLTRPVKVGSAVGAFASICV